jgi:putative transposase
MIKVAEELGARVGIATACAMLGVPRSSLYRARSQPLAATTPVTERAKSVRALSAEEQTTVRELLNSARFQDQAPREVYATLLDEGIYLCSWRTMYRILAEQAEVRERRDQLRHPIYNKPELLATAPNQLWSWDITKLKGPVTWSYYYLYVILDVFSRYVVGWLIAEREAAALAHELIGATCTKEGIAAEQLTLHADRGSSMTSKPVAHLLADLGVTKSHSRPYVANDNPFSEAQFKTLKYQPTFPERFGSLEDARAWARPFFDWYNYAHHHSGLGLMTPAIVHRGLADQLYTERQHVLQAAYQAHPERFVRGQPTPPALPTAVWINPPPATTTTTTTQPSDVLVKEADQTLPILSNFRFELSQSA